MGLRSWQLPSCTEFQYTKSQTGILYDWEEVKPLKPEGLSYPVDPPDTFPTSAVYTQRFPHSDH